MDLQKYRDNNSLDAIRAISAFGVVIAHTLLIPNLKVPNYVHHIDAMTYFVQVFFVLSALSLLLNNNFEDNNSIKNYYIKRFFRIAPLYYFFMVIYYFSYTNFDLYKFILNSTFTFELFGENSGIVWAGWTLGVEAIFYFILPIIYILSTSSFNRSVFFIAIVAISLFMHGHLYYLNTSSTYYQASFMANMGCFALGGLIAEALRSERTSGTFSLSAKIGFYAAAFALCGILISEYLLVLGPYWYNRRTLYGCVGALIIYAEIKRPSSILKGVIWSQLAKLSYGIYLWHPLIIYNMKDIYGQVYDQIPFSNTIAFLVCVLLTIVVTTIAATMSYFCIEKPAIEFARRLTSPNARHVKSVMQEPSGTTHPATTPPSAQTSAATAHGS